MKKLKSFSRIACAGLFMFATLIQLFSATQVSAAQITDRSLTLLAGATDGGSLPGGTVNHRFDFTLPTNDPVGSIKFQYCTTAAPVPGGVGCVAPTGIDVTNVALGNESGATGFTGMAKVNDDDDTGSAVPLNTVIINRASASAATGAVSYRLDNVVNPSNRVTFFARISTYASLDGTGTAIDSGTVAAATNYAIELDGTMPESLVFCTGADILVNAGLVPDCSTATAGNISFDRLFSPTDTAIATSKMAASTNAGFGYTITVNGTTLTSGVNTIAAMDDGAGGPTTSIQGTPQFGLNLVENLTTADVPFGAAVTQTGGSLYTGTPTADYNTAESFKYLTADPVASSTGGSDAQIFTVAYMANVSGSQPAGTYATTLTYVCTPKF
jgi:hypothetical protein